MRKNYFASVVVVMLVCALAFAGCSKATQTEKKEAKTDVPKEVVELTIGHSGSPTHHYQKSAEKFAKIVAEKTDGQIKINIFPSDQLGAGPDELEAVTVGTQDMVITPDAFIANYEPLFNVLGMPYQIISFDQVKKIPDSEFAKILEEKAKEKNIVILGWMANGFRLMTSNTAIETPEDVKGLKFRIGSAKLISHLLSTLGANPTPVSMSETYTALQTGIVDGQENPTTNIMRHKLYEVQKYLAITRHQYVNQPLVMNKNKFESLSPEFQQILLDVAKEVAAADVEMVENAEADQLEELKANGMTITEPDKKAFKEALAPLYEKYAKENGEEWGKLIGLVKEISK